MFRAHVLIVRRAKTVLYSLWYHHTGTSEWSKITKIIKIQFYKYEHMVVKFYYHVLILTELYFNNFSNFRPFACFSVMIPETVQYNFCPPDDEHMCSKHVQA